MGEAVGETARCTYDSIRTFRTGLDMTSVDVLSATGSWFESRTEFWPTELPA